MNSPGIDSLLKKLQNGLIVYGTAITVNAPLWPKIVAAAGLDYVFIDTEHIPLGRAELSGMCHTYQALGLTPIVRIPSPDPYRASQVIDDGAKGVIVPYIENVQQVRDLVGAVKYRPLKGEKLQDVLNGKTKLSDDMKAFLGKFNRGNICIANIESVPALEKLDELLSIEGLDGVFIGPHDLSISLGHPEQYDHPEVKNAIKTIIKKARKHTLGVGIHFSLESERQIEWIKEGVNIVIHSSDTALFSKKLHEDLAIIRDAAGEEGSRITDDGKIIV